jgi:Phosphoribosylcarboxyaminoimidazole (NCAIR) mutase
MVFVIPKNHRGSIWVGTSPRDSVSAIAQDSTDTTGLIVKLTVASAHRTPERVTEFVRHAEKKG